MIVLITGVAGKLGRVVARRLAGAGHTVLGVDTREWTDPPDGVELHAVDIRKRPAEDLFRTRSPDAVIHMATVTHLTNPTPERMRINLQGTRAAFDHSHTYGVKQVIFVGRHTYYGAGPDSPLYHSEDEPPMAIQSFPELADLVAADLYAGSALWRYPALDTTVLRMCYTLGPRGHGTLAAFLSGARVPTVFGYDPLYQFMHEEDVARALAVALEKRLRGVFNVTGPEPVPLSIAIRETGRTNIPVPAMVLNMFLGRFGLPRLPPGAIEFMKYPVVTDGKRFRDATGFEAEFDAEQTFRDFADAWPARRG